MRKSSKHPTRTTATITPKHNVGYIALKTNKTLPVTSVVVSLYGTASTDIVLDFDTKTHELVGIEFLDLTLMPSNWKKIAINYDTIQKKKTKS